MSFEMRLKKGEKVYGLFISSAPWAGFIEHMKHKGYDFVVFDTEHGNISHLQLQDMMRVCRLIGIHAIVRVTDKQYHLVSRAMDMGTDSIMMPRVENVEQVKDLVSWAKYPPLGVRGAGTYTVSFEPDSKKFIEDANSNGVIIIQIESANGIDNLDNIIINP
ncbi:MAG: aldolase/citrate lyase family protein, partial [Proteobacteria bacterium]|nr:aldolase/citrate lyase family protein [Pseudomonadota bacterium]